MGTSEWSTSRHRKRSAESSQQAEGSYELQLMTIAFMDQSSKGLFND